MLNVSIYRSFIFLVFLFVLFIRFCSGDFVLSARVLICRYVTRFPLFHSRRVPLSLCFAVPLFLSPCFPKFPCPCTTWFIYSQIFESPSSSLLLFPCFCALTPSNYSPICMFFFPCLLQLSLTYPKAGEHRAARILAFRVPFLGLTSIPAVPRFHQSLPLRLCLSPTTVKL